MKCLCVFPKGLNESFTLCCRFHLPRRATTMHGIETLALNAIFLKSHFLLLSVSFYVGQPLIFFSCLIKALCVRTQPHNNLVLFSQIRTPYVQQTEVYETDFTNLWHTRQKYFTSDFNFKFLIIFFVWKTMLFTRLVSTAQSTQLTLMHTGKKELEQPGVQ